MPRSDLRTPRLAALVLIAVAALGCGRSSTVRVTFTVDGMTCESCSAAITDALTKVDGVEQATADHVAGTAEAVVASPAVSPEQLVVEIEGLGYTVTSISTASAVTD